MVLWEQGQLEGASPQMQLVPKQPRMPGSAKMSLPCTHSYSHSFLLSPDFSPHLSNEGAREM